MFITLKSWNGTKLVPTPNPKPLIISIFTLSAIENTIIRATIRGLSQSMALPFILKSILLRQKKNYENSNISPCKNIIFKKILQKKPKSIKIS
jgi:hypothetical protein